MGHGLGLLYWALKGHDGLGPAGPMETRRSGYGGKNTRLVNRASLGNKEWVAGGRLGLRIKKLAPNPNPNPFTFAISRSNAPFSYINN